MKDKSLRVLIIEDSEDDALLVIRKLKKDGYNPVYERVETAAAMKKALKEKQWDIILCDYKMPKFNAPSAIALLKETNIDIPIIIVSGTIGEDEAIECMRSGAQDYIMKGNLSRLCPAVARELEEAKARKKQRQSEFQREKMLESLHQNEEKYRTILESIQEGYFEVDLAGNFIFCNDSMYRLTGCPKGKLLGMSHRHFTDKETSKEVFQAFNKVYKTGEPSKGYDWQIIREDATKSNVEASASLQKDSSGKPIGFKGILRDISERKKAEETLRESEERYRALFDRSLDLVYVIDFEGLFIDANDTALNRLGYKREDLRTVYITQLLSEDQLPLAIKTIQDVRDGILISPVEFRLQQKNGSYVYVETQGSIIMSHGTPVAIQAVARDITERKRAEEKLQRTLDSLRKAFGAT
ncbi:MAG: PAS domain S-box protein, partial [Deltaproteobacteria bacterium]|nr:PAS domain S-box protein [Deltaproteobacteria bacterium]